MPETNSFDVFLSHNSDDKRAVEALARQLEDEVSLKPFLDKWHLVPGNPWQEELESALDNSRTCAVFVGPTGISPWQNEEMRSALNTRVHQPAFRVVPVLLPGATMPERGHLPSFLSRLTWVDFRGSEGIHDTEAFKRLVAGITGIAPGRNESGSRSTSVVDCPYRGLKAFEEEQAKFFFGREATTQHLIESLRDTSFLAVLGPSGSGKSSVVRAGLLPRLRIGALPFSEQWRYYIFKPGAHPLEELTLGLAPEGSADRNTYVRLLADSFKKDERALHIEVRLQLSKRPTDVRYCFIVDQFEEVFTLCQNVDERERFVDLLRYATTVAGGQTIVVLTMRSDFLSRAAEYIPLAEILSAQQFLISPMDQENLRQIIEEPARLVGLGWEKGLVETILQDIGREPGMLPLLEDGLFQLWEKRNGKNVMTLSAYQTICGVRGALAQRAETLFTKLSPEQQQVARRILLRLTQPGEGTEDTRRRTSLQELETKAEESEVVKAVVQTLADARLLVTEEQQVDVAHEALIRGWPRLRQWIDDDRSGLRIHRRITEGVEEWHRLEGDAGVLFRGAVLTQAQEWRVQHETEMNELERKFLDTSVKIKEHDEEERKVSQSRAKRSILLRWVLATSVGLFIGLGGGASAAIEIKELDAAVAWAIAGTVCGVVLGIGQWLVLKQHFKQAGWWIVATVGGWTAVVAGTSIAGKGLLVVGIFVGLGSLLGIGQWLVLKQHFKQAGWWIVATVGGLAIGAGVSLLVVGAGQISGGMLMPPIFGVITGLTLIWLLQRPISKTEGDKN